MTDKTVFTEEDLKKMDWCPAYPDFMECPNCHSTKMECNEPKMSVEEWTCESCGKRWRVLLTVFHMEEMEQD